MALQIQLTSNTQHLAILRPMKFSSISTRLTSFRLDSPTITRMRTHCTSPSNMEPAVFRPSGNFEPNKWGDYFTSLKPDEEKFKSDSLQTELLKEEVKKILVRTRTSTDSVEIINLINTLSRLGISYHFEDEIEQQLTQIFDAQPKFLEEKDYDLYTVALVFRVLRQHGFNISCDVFNKFLDVGDNKFKESLVSDLKGMLSLYEAAHLSIPGNNILDEALDFTKTHLESLATTQASGNLCQHIKNALEQPLHTGVPLLEARKYSDLYEKDECRNETLYKFAKYDYRRVQFLHRQELTNILEWWKANNLATEYSYSRDIVVESYFWMLVMHFEPHYARARMVALKVSLLITIIDDTYDSYGTYEEIQCFTEAIERWDYGALQQLPDYMKSLYKAILDVFREYENDATIKGRPYSIDHAREEVKKIVRAYGTELNWLKEDYVPKLNEYLRNEVITGAAYVTVALSCMGMEEIAGIREFEWLASDPKICRAASTIARLMNDIAGHEGEQRRGRHPPSSIQCYMKQYGVSKKEAIKGLQKMIENEWKDLNEQCMRPTNVPRAIIIILLNYARLGMVLYKYGDGNTIPEYIKEPISKILVDELSV